MYWKLIVTFFCCFIALNSIASQPESDGPDGLYESYGLNELSELNKSDGPNDPDKPRARDRPDGPSDRPNQPNDPDRPDKPNNPDRPNGPDRPDRPCNPDRPNKPCDPDRPDRPDKPNDPDRPDRPCDPNRPNRPCDPDRPNGPDRPDEPHNPDRPDRPCNPDRPNKPCNPDRPDRPDKPNDPDRPDRPCDPNRPNKPCDPDRPNGPDKPDGPHNPDRPDRPNLPDRPNDPNKPNDPNIPDNSDESSKPDVPSELDSLDISDRSDEPGGELNEPPRDLVENVNSLEEVVAYGERILVTMPSRVSSKIQEVLINDENVEFWQQNNGVILDIPEPPNDLDDNGQQSIIIKLITIDNETIERTYQPFGVVMTGQVTLLIKGASNLEDCNHIIESFEGFSAEAIAYTNISYTQEIRGLCFAVLDIGKQGTKEALQRLQQSERVLEVDRNVVFYPDQSGNSYDPTCRDIQRWLDPIASNYESIDTATLLSTTNADQAHSKGITGKGVTIAVIGGGIDGSVLSTNAQIQLRVGHNFLDGSNVTNDEYSCDLDGDGNPDILGHDSHIAQIIHDIAPDAEIMPLKICRAKFCPSGSLSLAIFYLWNSGNQETIANVSLGGLLEDRTLLQLLKIDDNFANRLLLMASAGNRPPVDSHFPSDHAKRVDPTTPSAARPFSVVGDVGNVIAIAATGLPIGSSNWELAPFNRDEFAERNLEAPGVSLCPESVANLGFRCNSTDPMGISGTSFAAPVAAGIAALYAETMSLEQTRRELLGNDPRNKTLAYK